MAIKYVQLVGVDRTKERGYPGQEKFYFSLRQEEITLFFSGPREVLVHQLAPTLVLPLITGSCAVCVITISRQYMMWHQIDSRSFTWLTFFFLKKKIIQISDKI
jgi:hypothetical protein